MTQAHQTGQLKRKSLETSEPSNQPRTTTPKVGRGKGKEQPINNLNPESFFEVRVEYDTCVDLAYNLGLKPDAVLQTIEEDNNQRREEHAKNEKEFQREQDDDDAQVRFDYTDTEDDLDSPVE